MKEAPTMNSGMNTNNARTDWFYHAQWGVFVHYLSDTLEWAIKKKIAVDDWNRMVGAFDVKGLAGQLELIGSKYIILTIGQNSGFFCTPNDTYDKIVGIKPSKCSRRDLINDLADELIARGIKTLVYLPSLAPARDVVALERLKCTPPWKPYYLPLAYRIVAGVDDRLTEFQRNWEAIIREWSMRWGKKVCGWWIDGCYENKRLYNFPDEPNFKSFAAAMRAGNPDSIVAWNPGIKYPPYTLNEEEDYTAGEIQELEKVDQLGRWVKQAQFHVLTYIGEMWGRLPIRYSPEEMVDYSHAIIDCGGVITWDVPHTPEGLIVADAYRQLMVLGKTIKNRGRANGKRPQLPQTSFQLRSPHITPEGNLVPGLARVTLQNHWSTPISGTVHLQPSGAPDNMIRVVPPAEYRIAPGEKCCIEKQIVLTRPETMKARLRVMVSQSDGSHAVHYPLPARKAIRLPTLPAGVRRDDLPKALSGVPASAVQSVAFSDAAFVDPEFAAHEIGAIRLGMAHDRLCLWAQINDSLMQRTERCWDGSCIEVFAAANDIATIGQLLLLPATVGKDDVVIRIRSEEVVPVSQVDFRSRRNETGYSCCATISIPRLIGTDIMPDYFLLEMAVSAGGEGKFRRGVLFGEWNASSKTYGYGVIYCA